MSGFYSEGHPIEVMTAHARSRHWTVSHLNRDMAGWCAWERDVYGTCCHDLALAEEAEPFLRRLSQSLYAHWFFFRVRLSIRLSEIKRLA